MSERPVQRRISAFTLIEILAVVAIFALLTGLLAPRVGSIGGRTLTETAQTLASRLELARQRAVITGIPHRLLVDLDQQGFRIEWRVTEARAEGLDEEPLQLEPDIRGETPIPMSPERGEEPEWRPLPGRLGRFELLADSISFAGIESDAGYADRGSAEVAFEFDGTATDSSLFLDDESGRRLELHVLPLADAVRIHEVEI